MPIDSKRLDRPETSYDNALAHLEADTIRGVNREMRGQDTAHVHAALTARLQGRFPGVEHNELHLRRVAAAIARGTMPDQ